jgi:hypothetical protein
VAHASAVAGEWVIADAHGLRAESLGACQMITDLYEPKLYPSIGFRSARVQITNDVGQFGDNFHKLFDRIVIVFCHVLELSI